MLACFILSIVHLIKIQNLIYLNLSNLALFIHTAGTFEFYRVYAIHMNRKHRRAVQSSAAKLKSWKTHSHNVLHAQTRQTASVTCSSLLSPAFSHSHSPLLPPPCWLTAACCCLLAGRLILCTRLGSFYWWIANCLMRLAGCKRNVPPTPPPLPGPMPPELPQWLPLLLLLLLLPQTSLSQLTLTLHVQFVSPLRIVVVVVVFPLAFFAAFVLLFFFSSSLLSLRFFCS